MRIAITADLHWGHNQLGDAATRLLLTHLGQYPPDLLLLGGDIGTNNFFGECLQLFDDVRCPKALIPGNHDLWVTAEDARGDSMLVYEKHLPDLCAQHEFQYLDHRPMILPEANLAIVGNINWYDYSWSIERMKAEVPDWQWHLDNKAFTRGRHNDGRFVRWATNDVNFTRRVVETIEKHLNEVLGQVERVIVMTHHPAFYGITFPRPEPAHGLDALLWEALSGNESLETLLKKHADRIALIVSGHTHRAAEASLAAAPGYNIGGDYHFKRLLTMDWPTGTIEATIFGDPDKRR